MNAKCHIFAETRLETNETQATLMGGSAITVISPHSLLPSFFRQYFFSAGVEGSQTKPNQPTNNETTKKPNTTLRPSLALDTKLAIKVILVVNLSLFMLERKSHEADRDCN